jgi:succinoglycan biosynthesis transport protein ExoP
LKKTLGLIMAMGLLGGIGLAFLIELVLDRSVRRPIDLEAKLQLPLLLSIPDSTWKGAPGRRSRALEFRGNGRRLLRQGNEAGASDEVVVPEIPTWDPHHSLHPYYAGLRDRLLTYFESKNMTRKPKLVGVTSCSKFAGVTTVASGLAASLSETGDGNVLLVDMTPGAATAHPFYKGKPGCGLADIFEVDKRDAALVRENLYMVCAGEANDNLPRVMPKKLTEMFPKFKASDYDYIIFDMPPVSTTSMTARLTGYLDMVLMVVESGQTNRELVKQSSALILKSQPNLTTILNKTRRYAPDWINAEL